MPKQHFDSVLQLYAVAHPIIHSLGFLSELSLDMQQRKTSFQSGQAPDLDRWGNDMLRCMAECHCSAF